MCLQHPSPPTPPLYFDLINHMPLEIHLNGQKVKTILEKVKKL